MNGFDKACELLPARLRSRAHAMRTRQPEELRLRIGRCPTMLIGGKEYPYSEETVRTEDLLAVLEKATAASLHAVGPALRDGYLSYGGLRIGICGRALVKDGELSGFQSYSSVAIRIPRECRGICSAALAEYERSGFGITLLISPPGGGKTTALRELIRCLSERGTRIGIVDERNELSGTDGTAAQFDLGPCSDAVVGLGKREGTMLLLRGMNPQILAVDEITREEDAETLLQCWGCGVGLLASAHAPGPDALSRRAVYRRLLEAGVFRYALCIRRESGGRRYELCRISQ